MRLGGGSEIFFDDRSGYHQVSILEKEHHKTVFITPFGLYEYHCMPFQRLMQSIMSDLVFHIALVYLDDLLVYYLLRSSAEIGNSVQKAEGYWAKN